MDLGWGARLELRVPQGEWGRWAKEQLCGPRGGLSRRQCPGPAGQLLQARCSHSAFSYRHLCRKWKMIVNFCDVINQSYLNFIKVIS